MHLTTEDPGLRQAALDYVIELYDELSQENGAPTLGTQNQAVDFILADPELCDALARWAAATDRDPPVPVPPQRLHDDMLYRRVRAQLERSMGTPVFERPGPPVRP